MNPDFPTPARRRRSALMGLCLAALALAGCGGGGGGGGGSLKIRALNLTADLPTVDIYANDTATFSGAATNALAEYKALDAATYTLKIKRPSDGATLLTGSYALAQDQSYTAIVWGRETALRLSTLPENEDNSAIATGNSRVRMFNATVDTGALDVFLTATTTDIGDAQPTQSGVATGSLSGFKEIATGTYRLRVTGAGDPSDLRLDVPAIVLGEQQHATLVLTPGASGVLVNGTLLVQQGAQTVMTNTKARLRVVASVDNGGNVAASLGATTLVGSLRSPSVGPYQLVDASLTDLTVRINGAVLSSGAQTFVAGSDYTLMVYGSAAAGQLAVLTDDNRLPNSTTRAKVRLLHGLAGADPLTLSVDYLALATDLPSGSVSSYSTLNSSASARVDVTSATAAAPLFTAETVNLQGSSVYTVFMLSGNASPTGVIRKER
jgi:hypothetical protein